MEKIKQDLNTFLVDAFNTLMQIEENYYYYQLLLKGNSNDSFKKYI